VLIEKEILHFCLMIDSAIDGKLWWGLPSSRRPGIVKK
jgi:hypothetical protein